MRQTSPQPQNQLERKQINRSAARLSWRGFKEWVYTEAGRERFQMACLLFAAGVAMVATYRVAYVDGSEARVGLLEERLAATQAALEAEIKANRNRTIENGCIGMAILAALRPEMMALPDWCVPILEHLPERRPTP